MTIEADDHYLPDPNNAHINTTDFEITLDNIIETLTAEGGDTMNLWHKIYERTLGQISNSPEEPADEALICRYLTPTKVLWFVNQTSVYFSSASGFEDKRDCDIPDDYKRSIQRFMTNRNVESLAWSEYAESMRARWLVSCWTNLDEHHDDYLLWHRYAGGKFGVGITLRYGHLKTLLEQSCIKEDKINEFVSGFVSYNHPLRKPPFNKRRIFRNEKEIRFVCRADLLPSINIDISPLKKDIGLRFSPDAPQTHIDSVSAVWVKMGGENRIQISGE